MIGLIQNKIIYEYDIRSLILAFMLGEKIELTDHVDSIYDFILDVDYKDQEIVMNLYKKGELEDEIQLFGDYENKKIFKNRMKQGIYQLFSKALDKQLPWGTLTGIRPTKIAFDGYEKGESSEEIIHRFQKDYLASEEKARLCTETVQKEKELLKAFPYKEGYSLYIGIPFCPSTCLYCSFTSYSIDQFENIVQDYLEALLKELDFVAKTYAHKELQTMYIGGGTPTSLKEEDLEYLLYEVNKRFPFSKIQEITVEAGRSQLANSPQKSFFYPSVGVSWLPSSTFNFPEKFNYLKIRASWASVANPFPRELTIATHPYDDTISGWDDKSNYPIGQLYPERTKTWELGFDARSPRPDGSVSHGGAA